MLIFQLAAAGRLEITVYGPGPSCNRLGTFERAGRPGDNQVLFWGRLDGRPLPAGRYAIVVEVVRGGSRVRVGRVLVEILPRDGREGGSRPLPAPQCARHGALFDGLLSAIGGVLSASGGQGPGQGAPTSAATGVAGVSTARSDDRDTGPSIVPPLPPLPAVDADSLLDALASPIVLFGLVGLLAAAAGAAAVAYGVRRDRESWY